MRSSLVNWRLKIGRVLFLFSSFEALIGEGLLFDSTFYRVEEKIKGRERIKYKNLDGTINFVPFR